MCFYGKVGGRAGKDMSGESLDPSVAFEYYKKNIFDRHSSVDIFMHSWSPEAEHTLNALYEPAAALHECQPSEYDKHMGNSESAAHLFGRSACRWLSTKKVIDLKKKHEEESGFIYDMVMLNRYDVAWVSPLDLTKFDRDYMWVSHWNDGNVHVPPNTKNHTGARGGFLDLWFFGASSTLDKMSLLFDRMDRYHPNPHVSSLQHTRFCKIKYKFAFYRWQDYDLVRRKIYGERR